MDYVKKAYKYLLMVFMSIIILFVISIFSIGFNLSVGRLDTNKIEILSSEIQIVGKAYDASMRVSDAGKVFFVDCQIGMGSVCDNYYHQILYAKNVQLLSINDAKSTIMLYGELRSQRGEIFIINNLKNVENLSKQWIDKKRIYPKFFFYTILVLFPFVVLGSFFIINFKVEN